MLLTISSQSAEGTARIGALLGSLLRGGEVICLSGELGAGKTALTTGIGRGWGAQEPVNSPTFVFVHEHRRAADKMRLFHLDCYRLSGLEDAYTTGIEDMLSGSDVVVIEWPERIAEILPPDHLWIEIAFDPASETGRRLTLISHGALHDILLGQLGVLQR